MNHPNPKAFPENPPASIGGMSLRDYFAAKALPEAIALQKAMGMGYQVTTLSCALLAYQLADAMLAERLKTHS